MFIFMKTGFELCANPNWGTILIKKPENIFRTAFYTYLKSSIFLIINLVFNHQSESFSVNVDNFYSVILA